MKKILITGASGFLGHHILQVFQVNHACYTLGRTEVTSTKHYTTSLPLSTDFKFEEHFSTVIHNAGKAHLVPKTEKERQEFHTINTQGTRSLLKTLTANKPEVFVFISSVAVYGAKIGDLITEEHALDASDPYGKSKIEAEKLILDWGNENEVKTIILRLPLVYGDNLTGNLKAMLKALQKGYFFLLKKGKAFRSVVFADDVAQLLLQTEKIPTGVYNLTSSYNPSFSEIATFLAEKHQTKKAQNLPLLLAYPLALTGSFLEFIFRKELPFNLKKLHMMSQNLTFSSEKAKKTFQWNPRSWKGLH